VSPFLQPGYVTFRVGVVARTVTVAGERAWADLDAEGRVLGVDLLGGMSWPDALLAMVTSGMLIVPPPGDKDRDDLQAALAKLGLPQYTVLPSGSQRTA
jgi:hypothetical protein